MDLSKLNKNWLIGGVVALIVVIGAVVMMMPKHLDGAYSGEVSFLFIKNTDTLTFKGGEVTEHADGDKTRKGTYTLKGDQLEIKLGIETMKATLTSDKKAFTIDAASGDFALAKGVTYTKK
ncbi:hypothetical protein [Lacticaseibacillus absianus]|uniref:hypothetical protein n=1 Tax=Lacticaseibacillus absianus TaxID=2729623 RepID=UPI0015C6E4BB|nr:hypothetical protein [Lacticaseibacillus absianus]